MAQLGTKVLKAGGGWKEANRALRKVSMERRGDHFEELHGDFFEGLVHPELLAKARENALHGIQARSSCDKGARVRSTPHPSLKEYLEEAASQLWKDASKGRALITEHDGTELLAGVVSVPMARVPKMMPDRTLSTKGRVIWDATAVNRTCAKENHPPALQPRHSEMARAILWWKQRFPFARILLSKKDISDAFKWVPVQLDDTRLFAADLPGKEFGISKPITVIYNTLTFGWTGAPGEFMLFAWVAKMAHLSYAPDKAGWNDSVPFRSMVLMDDTVLVEPEVGVRPWLSVHASERCTKATIGPHVINPDKDKVEGALEEKKLIWGLLYDTAKGTRSLPAAKLEKASYLLHLPEFDYGCTKVPLKLVQELRGNQQFWLTVLPTMANFLQASNELLGPPDECGFAQPRGTALRQKRTWFRFWEAVELQRLLVDNRLVWESRFTHPLTEALSVAEAMAFCKENVIWTSGDATLEKVAAIDWKAKKAFAADVSSFQDRIQRFMKEACLEAGDPEEGEDSGYVISVTELLAVITLCALRAPDWANKLVLYGGDNQNVIGWLERRHARHPVASYLLQVLAALEAAHSFRVCGAYVRTYHNVTADDLTRLDPAQVMEDRGLEKIEGAAEALQVYLERDWIKRALVWAGQADADRCQALRLADRRSGDTHPLMRQPMSALYIKNLDLSGGLQRYHREFSARGAVCFTDSGDPDLPEEGVDLITLTLDVDPARGRADAVCRGVLHARPHLVWADSLKEGQLKEVTKRLRDLGYQVRTLQISGRTLRDQVWWRRWVAVACKTGAPLVPCRDASEEPATEVLKHYDHSWHDAECEEPAADGRPHLDPQMPFLGPSKPKPCGHVLRGAERKLVWSPSKPLPALHLGSWREDHPENLLLHVAGKHGPVARPLTVSEACRLLDGKHGGVALSEEETASQALAAAPKKLAELAGQWAKESLEGKTDSPLTGREEAEEETRLGLCRMQWEDETEKVLKQWLHENPLRFTTAVGRVGGGKRGRRRDDEAHPQSFYASKALSRLLRHDGGRDDLPMTHEGWVKWEDLMRHDRLKRFSEHELYDAVMINDKERFTARPDEDGQWWVAAWSGHTIPGCVGPSRRVPARSPARWCMGPTVDWSLALRRRGSSRCDEMFTYRTHWPTPGDGAKGWRLLWRWTPCGPLSLGANSRSQGTLYGCAKLLSLLMPFFASGSGTTSRLRGRRSSEMLDVAVGEIAQASGSQMMRSGTCPGPKAPTQRRSRSRLLKRRGTLPLPCPPWGKKAKLSWSIPIRGRLK